MAGSRTTQTEPKQRLFLGLSEGCILSRALEDALAVPFATTTSHVLTHYNDLYSAALQGRDNIIISTLQMKSFVIEVNNQKAHTTSCSM